MNRLSPTILFALFLLFGTNLTATAQETIKGKFEHVVLFFLNNPDDEAEKAKLETGLRNLIKNSEFIVSAHLGVPAMTPRNVVDNSYSFNYTVTFDSKEAQDKYQVEPVHLEFIETHKHLWSKVLIYDSINLLNSE